MPRLHSGVRRSGLSPWSHRAGRSWGAEVQGGSFNQLHRRRQIGRPEGGALLARRAAAARLLGRLGAARVEREGPARRAPPRRGELGEGGRARRRARGGGAPAARAGRVPGQPHLEVGSGQGSTLGRPERRAAPAGQEGARGPPTGRAASAASCPACVGTSSSTTTSTRQKASSAGPPRARVAAPPPPSSSLPAGRLRAARPAWSASCGESFSSLLLGWGFGLGSGLKGVD